MTDPSLVNDTVELIDAEVLSLLRDSARSLCEVRGLKQVRAQRGVRPGFSKDAWKEMAEQGWLGGVIPENHGGQGLPFGAMRMLAEELSRGLLPEPLVSCAVQAPILILNTRNEAAKNRFLPEIARGDKLYAVAAGDDITLTRSEVGWILDGHAHPVYPGISADGFFVVAACEGASCIVAVPSHETGVSIEDELRADGTFSARIRFERVALPEEAHIASGAAAEEAIRRATAAALIFTGAELYGCMQAAFDLTIDYMRTRVQFNRPIGSFQALQHRAVDLFIQKELSLGVLNEAFDQLDAGVSDEQMLMTAYRAKARCSHAAMLIGRESVKLHGAIAYTDEYDAGLYLRRIISLAALHGNARLSRQRFGALMERHGSGLEEEYVEGSGDVAPEFLSADKVDADWNGFTDTEFRRGVRSYFEAKFPHHLRKLGRRGTTEEMRDWLEMLARKGWMAPAWPVEQGGMGLSPAKQVIFIEERERIGIPRNPDQGVVMFGPMLMQYGTEGQKKKYLPKIVSNEHVWCQGYSEPNAGSDLASLRTEAKLEGDEFVINGSKIWTTMAHHATHMFLLARTDKTVRKQEGISFLVLDLSTPGVTIRPITNIAGHQDFCEVFFDNVRVPRENLVGGINQGWTVAKSLLGFERLNNGSPRRVQGPLDSLAAVARANGNFHSAAFQERYVSIYLDIADLKSIYSRFSDIVRRGELPGPEISQLKIWAGECAQKLAELLIDTAEDAGGVAGRQMFAENGVDVLAPFYQMFPSLIASGSNDIQRNILSGRVLGLPKYA